MYSVRGDKGVHKLHVLLLVVGRAMHASAYVVYCIDENSFDIYFCAAGGYWSVYRRGDSI